MISNFFRSLRNYPHRWITRDGAYSTWVVWPFFGLVILLSLPFYVLGASRAALPFVASLPLSALGAVVPACAALTLIHYQGGLSLTKGFLAATLEFKNLTVGWAVLAISFMPITFAVTGGLIWLSTPAMPPLQLQPMSAVIPAFVLFFVGAIGEELGWQGYAYPLLSAKYPAVKAALIIGVVWALWHLIPFVLMGHSAIWIIWHSTTMVLMRVVMVWLVVKARHGILVAVLFHMTSNSVWGLFSNYEIYYEPAVMFGVLLAPALAIGYLLGQTSPKQFRND